MATSNPFFYGKVAMEGMSDAQIKSICPAVFAKSPHSDVSSRYGFVETAPLLKAMRDHGFVPVEVRHHNKRSSGVEHTKHVIRFCTVEQNRKTGMKLQKVGEVLPQIVLVNSHDRTSKFELYCGLYRLICSNGLLVSAGASVEPTIIRHTTNSVDGLLDATGKLISNQKLVFEHMDAMQRTILDDQAALRFAKEALTFRPARAGLIEYRELLNARRPEDAAMDVWHVYNRVQENLMKGGLHGTTADSRAVVTRGVEAVHPYIDINRKLWELAMLATAKTELKRIAKASKSKTAETA